MNQKPIETSPTNRTGSSAQPQAVTLVVIDDDPLVLRATARILADAGYWQHGGRGHRADPPASARHAVARCDVARW